MSENTTIEILKAWADIVIQRWISKISKLAVYETGELVRSFSSQVYADSQGDASKIVFAFLYYGLFPDMGVGKGVPYEMVSQSNRKVKPWYSKQLFNEVRKLGYIMAERYGERAMEAISLIENKNFFRRDTNDVAWKNSTYNN